VEGISMKRRVGVLISGRGTNLQALIDEMNDQDFPGDIVLVISNKPKAYGIERAKKAGIPTAVINHKKFESREAHERAVVKELEKAGVELVVLAGYMRILTSYFVKKFQHRMINIHPALLPSFPGTHAHKDALDHGVKITGCTAHFVDEGVDTGPIIAQSSIEILQDDTVESLSQRLLPLEHRTLVKAVKLWCENRLEVQGRHVRIKP
jgi:phosphoribosylglycinamide formyltransferase-1